MTNRVLGLLTYARSHPDGNRWVVNHRCSDGRVEWLYRSNQHHRGHQPLQKSPEVMRGILNSHDARLSSNVPAPHKPKPCNAATPERDHRYLFPSSFLQEHKSIQSQSDSLELMFKPIDAEDVNAHLLGRLD